MKNTPARGFHGHLLCARERSERWGCKGKIPDSRSHRTRPPTTGSTKPRGILASLLNAEAAVRRAMKASVDKLCSKIHFHCGRETLLLKRNVLECPSLPRTRSGGGGKGGGSRTVCLKEDGLRARPASKKSRSSSTRAPEASGIPTVVTCHGRVAPGGWPREGHGVASRATPYPRIGNDAVFPVCLRVCLRTGDENGSQRHREV